MTKFQVWWTARNGEATDHGIITAESEVEAIEVARKDMMEQLDSEDTGEWIDRGTFEAEAVKE